MIINGLKFELTCDMCPEQYDVYKDNKMIAYVRLRYGTLRCDVPKCGEETIYITEFDNRFKGDFESNSERDKYLNDIAIKINKYYKY